MSKIENLLRLEGLLARACAYEDVITRKDAADLLQAFKQLRSVYGAALAWSVADHTPPHEVYSDAQVEQSQRVADVKLLAALEQVRLEATPTPPRGEQPGGER